MSLNQGHCLYYSCIRGHNFCHECTNEKMGVIVLNLCVTLSLRVLVANKRPKIHKEKINS